MNLLPLVSFSQAETTIQLDTLQEDSIRYIRATVLRNTEKVTETGVVFLAERLFMPVPLGKSVVTDENGEARLSFPATLPGDSSGKVNLIARLEDDAAVESKISVLWGKKVLYNQNIKERKLSGSRFNAPLMLIIISNAIIIGVWGTMAYIVFLLFFRMKKYGKDYNPG